VCIPGNGVGECECDIRVYAGEFTVRDAGSRSQGCDERGDGSVADDGGGRLEIGV
jgi:hypothetical protein